MWSQEYYGRQTIAGKKICFKGKAEKHVFKFNSPFFHVPVQKKSYITVLLK
jgi:hypothetical protein